MIDVVDATIRLAGDRVVAGVDLRVPSGTWTMLIGPNGAGKSTLLRAVAGLVGRTGTIRIGGRDPSAVGARARARLLALVPQVPLLPPEMTVTEYTRLGRTAHLGFLGRAGDRDADIAREALTRMGLGELEFRPLSTMSGGERQRAVLARALAQEAPVLLLDEPTTALDLGRQQDVLDLVATLQAERGLTVLGAMHDLTLAGQYADRLALLDGGRLVAHGPPERVLVEALIARHYRARVRVGAVDGAPVVLPAKSGQPR
jgi:iron complex transport system ATP-binding protein